MKNVFSHIFLLVLFIGLSGCKISVAVFEGGKVKSSSGLHDCMEGQACVVDVSDPGFSETFTALPNKGWEFVGWAKGRLNLCANEREACQVTLRDQIKERFIPFILGSDATVYLLPKFQFVGIDTDGDGIKDHIDEDDDNDGIPDIDDTYPLDPENRSSNNFQINTFTASYFNSGAFITSEEVSKPAMNYSWDYFHGIPSQDFGAEWSGTIEIFNESQVVDFNFDVSWSDVELFVDGNLVSRWSNSNATIPIELDIGVHEIVVKYENNWHTVGFNVSFTQNESLNHSQASTSIKPLLDESVEVIYVGAYESGTQTNDSTIYLNKPSNAKVFLFVSSYSAVNWNVENQNNTEIVGIAYSSYAPRSTISYEDSTPTFEIDSIGYGYSNYANPISAISSIIDREPDSTSGAYALSSITVN